MTGRYSVEYPIKVLAYHEQRIRKKTMFDLLQRRIEDWDILVSVGNDTLYLSPRLPFVQKRHGEPDIEKFHPHSLLGLLLVLTVSFKIPLSMSTAETFGNMWDVYYEKNSAYHG